MTPKTDNPLAFDRLYTPELIGKTYTLDESDNYLLVAFERKGQGPKDKERFLRQKFLRVDTGEEVEYDYSPTSLRELTEG